LLLPTPQAEINFSCHYCSKVVGHNEAQSVWEKEMHYVVFSCSCGKENWQEVPLNKFDPQDFFKKGPEVERMVKVVQEKGV
jgi:hypothetical protein